MSVNVFNAQVTRSLGKCWISITARLELTKRYLAISKKLSMYSPAHHSIQSTTFSQLALLSHQKSIVTQSFFPTFSTQSELSMEAIYLFLPPLIYMRFTAIERDSCPKMHFSSVTSTSNSRTRLPDGKDRQQMPAFSKMPQPPTYIFLLASSCLLMQVTHCGETYLFHIGVCVIILQSGGALVHGK